MHPDTKWCGPGNTSLNGYNDLGTYKNLDKCCRAHDYCDTFIEAFKTKSFGPNNVKLQNPYPYTMSSCECDMKFRKCLHTAYSKWSKWNEDEYLIFVLLEDMFHGEEGVAILNIEEIYFRFTDKCIWEEHPQTGCLEYDQLKNDMKRCRVFLLDKTKEKKYQFFDLPFAVDDGKNEIQNKYHIENYDDKNAYVLDDLA